MPARVISAITVFVLILTLTGPGPATAATQMLGFETFPDGTTVPSGTVVRNQFADSLGIRFPDGVIVEECGSGPVACDNPAPEGTRAAVAQSAAEFFRQPFVMTFDDAQRTVTITVDGALTPDGEPMQATLSGYDVGGALVDESTVTFADATPVAVSVAATGDVIARAVVTGGPESRTTANSLVVDDIEFQSDDTGAPGTPVDTTPPSFLTVGAPYISTSGTVDAAIDVEDDVSLQSLTAELTRPDGTVSPTLDTGFVCGGTTTACGGTRFQEYATLNGTAMDGTYSLRWQACDASDNCIVSYTVTGEISAPDPEEIVVPRLIGLEANQGVQGRPQVDNGLSDGDVRYDSLVPLVRSKPMLLRGYFGTTGTPGRAAPTLRVEIDSLGGYPDFTLVLRLSDTGQTDAAVPAVSSDRSDWMATIFQQRPDPLATGNYVIPAGYLVRASTVTVEDRWVINLDEQALVIINTVGVISPGDVLGPLVATDSVSSQILPYLDAAVPAYTRLGAPRTLSWGGRTGWEQLRGKDECSSLLRSLWWAYGGRDTPSGGYEPPDSRIVTAAFVQQIDGCSGMANRPSRPFRDIHTYGGVMLSQMFGDVAAQELFHTMGLIHASNAHGESDGGAAEASWPYDHGAMGPDGLSVFGAVMTPDDPDELFSHAVTVVDPCPLASQTQRRMTNPICDRVALGEGSYRHDVMSYATGPSIPGVNGPAWSSDVTYKRAYAAIVEERIDPATGSFAQASDATVDGLMVMGDVDPTTGQVSLGPLLTKPVRSGDVVTEDAPEGEGTVLVELLDDSDAILLSRQVALTIPHGADTPEFSEILPADPAAQRLRVSNATSSDERLVSAAPAVTLAQPVVDAEAIRLNWTSSDADGDPIEHLVSVSTDGGATWVGVATVPDGAPTEVVIPAAEASPGSNVVVAVRATDGFTTTTETVQVGRGVQRIAGTDLRSSAIKTCQAIAPDVPANSVLLARDDVFADALAGAPMAGQDACILFTEGGPGAVLDPAVFDEIKRVLLPGAAVRILGGEQAISAAVADQLGTAGYAVERYAGPSRFETAVAIARQVRAENPGNDKVLLAYGLNWPDAVMAGAYGAATGTPIVLTDTDSLHPATDAAMTELGVAQTHVIGGTAVISEATAQQAPAPNRVAGPNRMATAVTIAEQLWSDVPATGNRALVANVEATDGWVLALAAAPLAARIGGPELGLGSDRTPTETATYLRTLTDAQGPVEIVVVGDDDAVAAARISEMEAEVP